MYSIDQINNMQKAAFINEIGRVFEHSPWVAERSWKEHPFEDKQGMENVLLRVMWEAEEDLQLSLLRAHPDLGTKLEVTASSLAEQKQAGLNDLSEEEFSLLSFLNRKYTDQFGFPFIMAVKGKTKIEIISSMQRRIHQSAEKEKTTALKEVEKIALFRLNELAADNRIRLG
ncbi:2-oxo-4-hydroxy-4-carboxy-5-ureidoimidazoline decarboxylase [Alkalicoccus halolimnae]|uniref:2-oxo-4-hydroxy-4-carboxy-5-ureidoimidazoline decarboxylase n=1 Tax=Alkalicoccus halolimnae TaxID=1667239 RepID=A0A5C7FF47_9BACI|nr:2-oxo-4-hydroxy-4-carboxy-5-ureidoimidazoline decarboxylase [Alkalicoccus halolimnae]TXF84595.1 2-oxo-4-hydroxy-4-carboxy-5-ureidoimidazoline decarboxylase [Alkalicoccus halolimnae]